MSQYVTYGVTALPAPSGSIEYAPSCPLPVVALQIDQCGAVETEVRYSLQLARTEPSHFFHGFAEVPDPDQSGVFTTLTDDPASNSAPVRLGDSGLRIRPFTDPESPVGKLPVTETLPAWGTPATCTYHRLLFRPLEDVSPASAAHTMGRAASALAASAFRIPPPDKRAREPKRPATLNFSGLSFNLVKSGFPAE